MCRKDNTPAPPTEELFDTLQSFNASVQDAGGTIYTLEELKQISLYEFLKICALNGIRFNVKEVSNDPAQRTNAEER